jgi:hypothetical protein
MTTPPTSAEGWRSPLAVRLAALLAQGLAEEPALARALAEQAAHHAQTCCEDCWLPDDEDEGVLRCGVCALTAPPDLQPTRTSAKTTRTTRAPRRR